MRRLLNGPASREPTGEFGWLSRNNGPERGPPIETDKRWDRWSRACDDCERRGAKSAKPSVMILQLWQAAEKLDAPQYAGINSRAMSASE